MEGEGVKKKRFDRDFKISALRKQLREVEMERDILKKAAGIFLKTTENGSSL